MVKEYFAACRGAYPEQRAELQRISLALRREGIHTMDQLCALQRAGPDGLLAIRDIGEKSLALIARVCARYETGKAMAQVGSAADGKPSGAGAPVCRERGKNWEQNECPAPAASAFRIPPP